MRFFPVVTTTVWSTCSKDPLKMLVNGCTTYTEPTRRITTREFTMTMTTGHKGRVTIGHNHTVKQTTCIMTSYLYLDPMMVSIQGFRIDRLTFISFQTQDHFRLVIVGVECWKPSLVPLRFRTELKWVIRKSSRALTPRKCNFDFDQPRLCSSEVFPT